MFDGNFGKLKVDVMVEWIVLIDFVCCVNWIEDFVEFDNFDVLFGGGFDYVIDVIDSVCMKVVLIVWCVVKW